jgi:hypothetical protein
MLATVRSMRFPSPHGGPEAEFTYSLAFRGKATLKPWTNDDVGSIFARHRDGLDACARKGNVPPALRVTFFVSPGGKAAPVGVGADGAVDEAYGRCLIDEVARWKFADPRGTIARATYEF